MRGTTSSITLLTDKKEHDILALSGDLTRDTIPDFWNKKATWLTKETFSSPKMRLDLSAIEKVDSAALAMLLLIIEKSRLLGCHLVLTALPNSLVGLFNISQAEVVFAQNIE